MSSDEIKWEMTGGRAPEHVQAVHDEVGEGGMVVVGGPDWVISPPELGSKKLYIKGREWMKMNCPVCRAEGPIHIILLEDDLRVSCCAECGQYGWFKKPEAR